MCFDKKQHSFDTLNNFEAMLKMEDDFNLDDSFRLPDIGTAEVEEAEEFRLSIDKINFHSLDNLGDRDSFAEEEQYYDPNEERHSDKDNNISNRSEEEHL